MFNLPFASSAPSSFKRILVIDSDPHGVTTLEKILSDVGEVTFCTDRRAALSLIRQNELDLVLLDVSIPDADGYGMYAEITRGALHSRPAVILIVSADFDIETAAIAADASDFITKPFHAVTVRDRVKAHLMLRQKNAELQEKNIMLNRLAAQVPGMVYQFRLYPDGRATCPFISESVRGLCNLTPEQLQEDAAPWMALIHPDDTASFWQTAEASAKMLSSWRHEYRVVLPSLGTRWVSGESQPERLQDGSILWHGYINDITERKEAEEREHRLMAMYRALSETNEAILRLQDESALFPLVCKMAVEYGEMMLAWIGTPNAENVFIPVATFGRIDPTYVTRIRVHADATAPEGKGPAGISFREQRSIVANDIAASDVMAPWQKAASEEGLCAVATFPILKKGESYALLIVYSDQVGAFNNEIVQLLDEMAANISFALDNFDRETLRHQAEAALRQSEARLKGFYDAGLLGVIYWKMDGEITEANDKFLEMVGYSREDLYLGNVNWISLTSPNHLYLTENAITDLQQTGSHQAFEKEYIRKDGTRMPISATGTLLNGDNYDGVAFVIDITERKKAEEELQLASLVYKNSNEGMTVTDAFGTILAVNSAFTALTGYSSDEVIGKNPHILKSGHHGREFYESMWQSLNSMGKWQGEIWNRRKDGEIYPEWLSINTTYNEDGSAHRRVALFSDITKRKELEELLWQQANVDLLTGLPNRRMFMDRLEQEIKKSERSGSPLVLIFLDLDYFKDINDMLGHGMGDVMLKETGQRIRSCVRESDTVARLGGDEFTILLGGMQSVRSAERVASEVMNVLVAPYQLGGQVAYISASIGITVYPQDALTPEDLLKNADQAMYAAKQQGRNRYHYFTQFMQDAAQTRMKLITDMRSALEEKQFRVFYQPIIELSTGAIYKAEALARWQHPTQGMVSPAQFIPLAEETGMILEIGDWVFHEAAKQAQHLRQNFDPRFQISVNKSPVQFRNDGSLYKKWLDHLYELELPGESMIIEITESMMMDLGGIVTDKLHAFRSKGIQIALDDFGTGYSSLSYLKTFDLDYLKIDRVFVSNLMHDSRDMALCEAIIVMAHKLGIKVIAEGVETEEQRGLLAAAGCDFGQGYLFSKPVPAGELDKFLNSSRKLIEMDI